MGGRERGGLGSTDNASTVRGKGDRGTHQGEREVPPPKGEGKKKWGSLHHRPREKASVFFPGSGRKRSRWTHRHHRTKKKEEGQGRLFGWDPATKRNNRSKRERERRHIGALPEGGEMLRTMPPIVSSALSSYSYFRKKEGKRNQADRVRQKEERRGRNSFRTETGSSEGKRGGRS